MANRFQRALARLVPQRRSQVPVDAEYTHDDTGEEDVSGRTLGTFGGVFTPSFLTIIGVIMFLRFSWVVGNAGLYQTFLIVMLANSITAISALSIASIGSNERMETGGAYFMVSRVLGFQTGGSIGVPLYISQALSIALYVLGFTEALRLIFPGIPQTLVALGTMVVLAGLGLVGARAMVRVQYVIFAAIILSLLSIALGFTPGIPVLTPEYAEGENFWTVFAVFFPAVTGILAGVSMSGDLRNPARSIPRGTLLAVAAGFVIYMLVPIMLAFSVGRADLFGNEALADASRWPVFVTIGVIGATLSSAIGSLLGAPRTLQALARDRIAPAVLEKGVGESNEPVLAMLISMVLATGAIILGNLNAVAEVLTMFFLTTYGVLNIAAGMEVTVGNPSFRPAIRVPAWVSFLGGLACFAVMILISPVSTAVSIVAVVAIFLFLGLRAPADGAPETRSGGVWEGYWTGRLFAISRRLEKSRSGSGKNWRPIVQVFARDTNVHGEIMVTAALLSRAGGALALYAMVEAQSGEEHDSSSIERELTEFASSLPQANVFANVIETTSFHEGVLVASQAAAFAGTSYNSVMLGLPRETRSDADFARMLKRLSGYDRNIVLFKRGDRAWTQIRGPIVVWWGGRENNVRLMLILAHILQEGLEGDVPIVLSTIIRDEAQRESTSERLQASAQALRISAELSVVVAGEGDAIPDLIVRESESASMVIMGMAPVEDLRRYLPRLRETTDRLQSVLLVQSNIPDVEFE